MSRHFWRACDREAGFSFVELLVTIIIAGIAFAALVPLFVQAQTVSSGDKMRAVALNVAQDRMEKLRQLDFELITEDNLNDGDFYFGEFGDTWTEATESGTKDFNVTYAVVEKSVSATDSRVAYKVVTVTVNWDGPPQPVKDVVLTTMIYRQYAGPQIVDFAIATADLGPSDPLDLGSEKMIVSSTVNMQAVVNSADLDSMRPRTIGSTTRKGHVDFLVTSSTGTVFPKMVVEFNDGDDALFPAAWTVPGGVLGASDGYYSFKAVAYTTMGSPGNSWQLTYRIETGAPAAVTSLTGTAGPTEAYLTWDASITGDVDHYRIVRDGVEIGTVEHKAGSRGYTDSGLTGPVGTLYEYTVYAVDWMGRETPATLSLTSVDATAIAPLPASDLQGTAIDSQARLTWAASPSAGVVGYRVYQTIGGVTNEFVTATATLDVPQGWESTALYQVKPYVGGGVLADSFATLLLGQLGEVVGAATWLRVDIGPEPLYALVIQNTTSKTLTSLRLYYLGPVGTNPQTEITPAASNVAVGASRSWGDLASGVYRWDWVTSNNKTGSQVAKCSGATLTIYGSTP